MSLVNEKLAALWRRHTTGDIAKLTKCLAFLSKILNKVQTNPNVAKYRDLNLSKIAIKYTAYNHECLETLKMAGFEQQLINNNWRLIFEDKNGTNYKMRQLSFVRQALEHFSATINIVSDNDSETNEPVIVDEQTQATLLQQLISMGYSQKIAQYALELSEYNIQRAIEIIDIAQMAHDEKQGIKKTEIMADILMLKDQSNISYFQYAVSWRGLERTDRDAAQYMIVLNGNHLLVYQHHEVFHPLVFIFCMFNSLFYRNLHSVV